MRALLPLLLACNPDPGEITQSVEYRAGTDETSSGERGNIKISEILWAGAVRDDGTWDPYDVFVEFRNEGALPVNMSNWLLQLEGPLDREWRLPASDFVLEVDQQAVVATRTDGCVVEPEWVLPDLEFPNRDPFELTLYDSDERLMEPAGSESMPPYAGGYDGIVSRSMERIQLMFGGKGSQPHAWHHYAEQLCSDAYLAEDPVERLGLFCVDDIPNNDRVTPGCRAFTLASPGRANSPDYSGAYASGSFE